MKKEVSSSLMKRIYICLLLFVASLIGVCTGYWYKGYRHPYKDPAIVRPEFIQLYTASLIANSYVDSAHAAINSSPRDRAAHRIYFKKDSATLDSLLKPIERTLTSLDSVDEVDNVTYAKNSTLSFNEQYIVQTARQARAKKSIFTRNP